MKDKNPYIGAIAHNLDEMIEISEESRKYERTGESTIWVNLETGKEVYSNI